MNRNASSNNNYKVFARIRPIDYQQKMIECQADNTVSIKDPASKNKEKQSFSFNGIFESTAQQENVWATVCEPILQKVIEGHNSCILSYGQTGSGKTYTIFGEDERFSINNINLYVDGRKDKRGLICRTLDFFFKKAQELEDIREFVLQCSLCEVYLDQVRDLGKPYAQQSMDVKGVNNNIYSTYENENLTIYENTNGQIVVKDLTTIQLKSMNELYDFLASSFQLREKLESKGNQIWARAHTIFTCNLIQKDKENENIPFMNSSIQFIDLAGSERIAKSLTEGHKFQEAILINSSLTALSKCLQQIAKSNKSIPYRESKLTKILQNCLSFSSHTVLIVNINPNESNYEESLSTLQYAERTRNAINYKQGLGERQSINFQGSTEDNGLYGTMGSGGGLDKKAIEKLKEELQDYKSKLEFSNKEHKEKMSKIQDLLGIETDLDKVLNKSSQKELNQFKLQREALVKVENLQKQNDELENYIKRLHKVIEDQKKDSNVNVEKQQCIIIEQREQIKKLKEQIVQNQKKSQNDIQQINQERESEIRNMIDFSNQLIEEKAQKIINLPQEIDKKTRENGNVNEVKKSTRHEVEREMKTQIENLKAEYSKLLETTKQQYEYFLLQKNEEIDNYVKQLKKYREKKKLEIEELQEEIQDLYDITQKQNKIINRVETGQYSGGIRSFNIPQRDKPHMPNRQKHKNLFKLLDLKHISSHQTEERKTMQSIKKGNTQFSEGEEIENEKKKNNQNENLIKEKKFASIDDMIDLTVNLNKLKTKDDFDILKVYAERIKDSLMQALIREKELKERVKQFEEINNNVDINLIIKERDEYKVKYLSEVKKHNQSRITIESQKRLINSKVNLSPNHQQSASGFNRPQTVQDRRLKSGTVFPGVSTGFNYSYK